VVHRTVLLELEAWSREGMFLQSLLCLQVCGKHDYFWLESAAIGNLCFKQDGSRLVHMVMRRGVLGSLGRGVPELPVTMEKPGRIFEGGRMVGWQRACLRWQSEDPQGC